MFLLSVLAYMYLTNTTIPMPDTSYVTSWMNTTSSLLPSSLSSFWMNSSTPSFVSSSFPSSVHSSWFQNATWMTPPSPMDPKVNMLPFATLYFLSGAVFFLGTAVMMLPRNNNNNNYKAIDGIATMSDFTKTSLRRKFDRESDQQMSRELRSLIHDNGMEFDEFVHRMMGSMKRNRRTVCYTETDDNLH
jgi:hypothetical protein